jgi:rhodanese-related sulfurtransferase
MEPSPIERRILERMEQSKADRGKISPRMAIRIVRMFVHSAIKRKWHLPGVSEISADELNARVLADPPPILIDLRTKAEFCGGYGHIPNSLSIPIGELEARLEELRSYGEREFVTICPGGGMSLMGAEIMAESGMRDVKSLKGGIDLWFKEGYPTTLY